MVMFRNLIICVISVNLISIIVGILLVFVGKKTCYTQSCKNISLLILEYMDKEVDPCGDFYTFSCGNLTDGKTKDVPADVVNGLLDQETKELIQLLENVNDNQSNEKEPKGFVTGGKIFEICQKESNKTRVDNILRLLKNISGFPTFLNKTSNEENWGWLETTRKLRKSGLYTDSLININIFIDPHNTLYLALLVSPPSHLDNSDCDDNCKHTFIKKYAEILVKMGAKQETAEKDASEVIDFGKKISIAAENALKIDKPTTDLLILKNRTKTHFDLISLFGSVDWNGLIKIMVRNTTKVTKEIPVVVHSEEYLHQLRTIIENSSNRTIANYMMWKALELLIKDLGEEFDKYKCFTIIKKTMPVMLNSLFLKSNQYSKYGNYIYSMIQDIKTAFLNSVKNQDWMSIETKQRAILKVNHIKAVIGYLNEFQNYELLDRYYETLYAGNNLLESILNINKHTTDIAMSCLCQSLEINKLCKIMFFGTASSTYVPNAIYSPIHNKFIVLEGFLRYPLFDKSWPSYVNYGKVGFVIGHELTHALDTKGSYFDQDGNLVDWWDKESFEKFTSKAACFIEEYNKFQWYNGTGMQNLPGQRQVSENIADSGGIKLSLEAYRARSKRSVLPELLLPGLDFTQEQIFLISTAQFFCSKYKEEDYLTAFLDEHSPKPVRVKGTARNSHYFSEVFSCKPGTEMNPPKKCVLW